MIPQHVAFWYCQLHVGSMRQPEDWVGWQVQKWPAQEKCFEMSWASAEFCQNSVLKGKNTFQEVWKVCRQVSGFGVVSSEK